MSPRRSKTIVRPSGETSTDIHVPSLVSKVTSVEGPCFAETSHRSGAVGVAAGVTLVTAVSWAEATPVASASAKASDATRWWAGLGRERMSFRGIEKRRRRRRGGHVRERGCAAARRRRKATWFRGPTEGGSANVVL